MEFKGRYIIPAAPDMVYRALHDPQILQASLPGCESVERISDAAFKARATIKVGPVKARFEGTVEIEERDAPAGIARLLILKGKGHGGAAGFARGEFEVRLFSEAGNATRLEYDAKAMIGGRLAQIGQRLIDGAAKAIANEFFEKFARAMTERTQSLPPPAHSPPPMEAAPQREEGLAPQIWVVGLIAIIVILLIVFSMVL